jgi:hypothetical protein
MVSLSDGKNPWLTINLLHDPTDTDLCSLRWAPNGRTLAFLDGDTLYTWNPNSAVPLSGGSHWSGPVWSPDSDTIAVSCPEKTLLIDPLHSQVLQQLNGEHIIWWMSGKLCNADRVFAAKRKSSDTQSFSWADQEIRLPAGLTLVSASPDGAVLVAQTNYAGQPSSVGIFMMLGIDVRSGAVLWVKPAPCLATKNYGSPDLLWNERLQMAAQTADAGGGFDFHGFVETGRNTQELKFASTANYSWISGPLAWVGDELFTPMTLGRVAQTSTSSMQFRFWNELALFDGRTGDLRSVATGLPFEAAAASDDYVALVIRTNDLAQIVITPWVKDPKGRIIGVTYAPQTDLTRKLT